MNCKNYISILVLFLCMFGNIIQQESKGPDNSVFALTMTLSSAFARSSEDDEQDEDVEEVDEWIEEIEVKGERWDDYWEDMEDLIEELRENDEEREEILEEIEEELDSLEESISQQEKFNACINSKTPLYNECYTELSNYVQLEFDSCREEVREDFGRVARFLFWNRSTRSKSCLNAYKRGNDQNKQTCSQRVIDARIEDCYS